jgi:L,D-transpeptidase ErfK/SrfK
MVENQTQNFAAHMRRASRSSKLWAVPIMAILVASVSSFARAQDLPPLAHIMVGSEFEYTVRPGDSLLSIGARKGIETKTLAAMNGLRANTALKPGQILRIDNRHVVPADLQSGILINLPQRKLFLLRGGEVASNYPVGPGKAAFESPIGEFSVVQMRENPTWYVPQSIQNEWARAGKVVKKPYHRDPETLLAATGWV